MKDSLQYISKILSINPKVLEQVGAGAIDRAAKENKQLLADRLKKLGRKSTDPASDIKEALFAQIEKNRKELLDFLGISPEDIDFNKAADFARKIIGRKEGLFLKKELAKSILKKHEPRATLDYLGHKTTEELLAKEDVMDVFSALRFIETDEWMHETFGRAYGNFGETDFEKRPIELRILGSQWEDIGKKFVEKKHHNVSHLKEFGVIFINPVNQSIPGKFLRDFALLLHYFYEIEFYSKLFERYVALPGFSGKFVSLLRGDVKEANHLLVGSWAIIQQYLAKKYARDPRLFLPHTNPEALHWKKAEDDLARFSEKEKSLSLDFWKGLDAVGEHFSQEFISFDLEDNAMSFVSRSENSGKYFYYHQQEALWNKIFAYHVGGYDRMEELILENMDKGFIQL